MVQGRLVKFYLIIEEQNTGEAPALPFVRDEDDYCNSNFRYWGFKFDQKFRNVFIRGSEQEVCD